MNAPKTGLKRALPAMAALVVAEGVVGGVVGSTPLSDKLLLPVAGLKRRAVGFGRAVPGPVSPALDVAA